MFGESIRATNFIFNLAARAVLPLLLLLRCVDVQRLPGNLLKMSAATRQKKIENREKKKETSSRQKKGKWRTQQRKLFAAKLAAGANETMS